MYTHYLFLDFSSFGQTNTSNSALGEMEDKIIFEVAKSLYQTNKEWHNWRVKGYVEDIKEIVKLSLDPMSS